MKVKCPRCGVTGEIVDCKCSICDLPMAPRVSKPVNLRKLYKIAIPVIAVIVIYFVYAYVNDNLLEGDLNGEIFIVTRGGENIRLGLAQVELIPANTVGPFIVSKYKDVDIERTNMMNKIKDLNTRIANISYINSAVERARFRREFKEAISYFGSGKYFFKGLPQGTMMTKTDADGKFTFRVKRGIPMALAARGRRESQNEDYYWLIWASLEGKSSKRIILSNDNLVEANTPGSVMRYMLRPEDFSMFFR